MKTPLFKAAIAIVRKDLQAELRSRELLSSMSMFALLSILIFSFALQLDLNARQEVVGGVLWVTVVFASILGLNRSMATEREGGSFDAMLLAGFVDEVVALRRRYRLDPDLPSMRCVGYRQALEYLDGRCALATFRDKGIFATRQLAKRQLTWQRNFRDNWDDLIELDCLTAGVEDKVREAVERALG